MVIGNYKVVNKLRFSIFITVTSILILGVILGVISLINQEDYTYNEWQDLRVQKGDTLWKIAKHNNPFNENTQKVVYKIMKFNKINEGYIKPGDIIKIPVN